MKNKNINLLIQREKARRSYAKQISGARNKIIIVLAVLLFLSAAFLMVDTNRMERRAASIEDMISSPENMEKYAYITELNRKETEYTAIISDLASIEGVVSSYPMAAKDFFEYLTGGNPGVTLTNFSYDGNAGVFNTSGKGQGYEAWTVFINKLEGSAYLTDYMYQGYEIEAANIHKADFSFRLRNSKGE